MFAKDSLSVNANGGTELMARQLYARLQNLTDNQFLDQFQIFVSRAEEQYDPTKIRLFWAHDLPGDPASEHLKRGGWQNYHRLVFVSHWQMQQYISFYGIPWSKCVVLQNAIEPINRPQRTNTSGTIRLGYWSTPHRGLNILVPVFDRLTQKYDNIELEVYSSFKLYGWDKRDEPYQPLFQMCRDHPKINYHGTVPNSEIRQALHQIDIMAYPSIWSETSCLCLIEAMSAGIMCVHPNLAALPETAANWTNMYQWQEDLNTHASHFYAALDQTISTLFETGTQTRLQSQKSYADVFYNWEIRQYQWLDFLQSLINEPRDLPQPTEMFTYEVGV